MTDMRSHSEVVHRSLLQRDLMAGIPQAGVFFLFIFGVVFIYGFQLYLIGIPVLVILFFVMRKMTKKDNYLIDIMLENTRQKDVLIP